MKKPTTILVITLASLIVIAVVLPSFVCVIPPTNDTHSAITESFVRMHMYLVRHQSFPASLDDLPKREGYANQTTDGWKRPLIYIVEQDNFVTLRSLGKDGQPGGTGEAADIQKTYRTKNPDGSWCVKDEMWIVTAEVEGSPTALGPRCHETKESQKGKTMSLEVNGRVVTENLDESIIRDSLTGLDVDRDGEGFAILAQSEMTYLQVSGDPKRGFDAEYQERDIENHYRAHNEPFTLDEVVSMMTEYLHGSINWEKYGTWSKIRW